MILFIYGAGGAGNEVYDIAKRNNKSTAKYSAFYFVDDNLEEGFCYGTKVMQFSSCGEYMKDEDAEFVIAVGEPSVRNKLYKKIKGAGYTLGTLIDETAIISDTAQISEGCVIYGYAFISSEAVVKENCFIMFEAIIGHHARVESDCVICPKATVGGHSTVGPRTFLGLGSSMIQGADIGKNVIVGLGSMVFRSVEDGATVVGNPARITKGNSEHRASVKALSNGTLAN